MVEECKGVWCYQLSIHNSLSTMKKNGRARLLSYCTRLVLGVWRGREDRKRHTPHSTRDTEAFISEGGSRAEQSRAGLENSRILEAEECAQNNAGDGFYWRRSNAIQSSESRLTKNHNGETGSLGGAETRKEHRGIRWSMLNIS